MPKRTSRPRFYFSFRSPYSWLAYRQLTDRHPALSDALDWHPFWEPDQRSKQMLAMAGGKFHYVDMSRQKHLYVLQDVDRLRRELGLEMTWPVDRNPVWEVPHLAYIAAADEGRGPQFVERFYHARWVEGRDICAPATIAELAAELGLPRERLAGAAEDDELRERGLAALLALDDDGVFGVPFFVHGRQKFWGVDRLAAFVRSVCSAEAAPVPVRPAAEAGLPEPSLGGDLEPGGDQGHAGGCG